MVLYLTNTDYNSIAALTDTVGPLSLSWLEFIESNANITIRPNDLKALAQPSYLTTINISAFQWAKAVPTIVNGINSTTLNMGAITGTFKVGETVNQATSSASGVIYSISGSTIVVNAVTGTFDNSHLVTGVTSGATSTPSTITASPNIGAYTVLAYLFGANINNEETSANKYQLLLSPQLTFEYAEPIQSNTNVNTVFSNLRASTSTTFAVYYTNGTLITTQNVTTDANGTAVVVINTGVLTGGTSEVMIKVTQQVAAAGTNMRGAISYTQTLYAQVS
jgi:hypothetical protein